MIGVQLSPRGRSIVAKGDQPAAGSKPVAFGSSPGPGAAPGAT